MKRSLKNGGQRDEEDNHTHRSDGSRWVTALGGSELSDGFCWANTPYQTQNITWYEDARFTKYLSSTSSPYKDQSATDEDALKTVLDPEDDAARVNWGGTWRMPTREEIVALCNATYWAWDATDKGYYVFSPDDNHSAGTRASSVPDDLSKTAALLFFPAAGLGDESGNLFAAGAQGHYWSSTHDSERYSSSNARYLYFDCIKTIRNTHKHYENDSYLCKRL